DVRRTRPGEEIHAANRARPACARRPGLTELSVMLVLAPQAQRGPATACSGLRSRARHERATRAAMLLPLRKRRRKGKPQREPGFRAQRGPGLHAGRGLVAAPRPPGPSWPVAGAQVSTFGPARDELAAHPRVVVYWPNRTPCLVAL